MTAASALDGIDGFGHSYSVLLDRRVRDGVLVGLGELLPHPTHEVAHRREQLCSFASRAELRLPGCAGKPCLAAAFAFVQCDYVHALNFTHTWA